MNLLFILLGLTNLFIGMGMMLFPQKRRLSAAHRKKQLAAGEPEVFFEESRAIDAYPTPKTDRGWRLKGALFCFGGVLLLALGYCR